MKNVNQLVMEVKTEGTESLAFFDLFNTVQSETIEPKAESYSFQLRGDTSEAISEGYQLLMELVEAWDGTGNFHTLFKASYNNRLKNLVKKLGRDKRKHNTDYSVSLSTEVQTSSGEKTPILEVMGDEKLSSAFDVTEEENVLETLLAKFNAEYPEQAGLVELMIGFDDDMKQADKTSAYVAYFGVQSYTSAIQKKVSRSREAFKKFLVKNDYQVAF